MLLNFNYNDVIMQTLPDNQRCAGRERFRPNIFCPFDRRIIFINIIEEGIFQGPIKITAPCKLIITRSNHYNKNIIMNVKLKPFSNDQGYTIYHIYRNQQS